MDLLFLHVVFCKLYILTNRLDTSATINFMIYLENFTCRSTRKDICFCDIKKSHTFSIFYIALSVQFFN